ncbi:unnamed protein product [Psylliodes chrysocephalus]|uniref:Uncharacterized protein n=1 Tax=Psylliodes chrysocephalus TaxID=3402493 RepID=A0A9P0CF22_9CUCU|nr:unnamed protein product [Psylliodes chrysocephala]
MLECVQPRATRLTFGRIRPSCEERLEMGNLITFQQRRLRCDLILWFRIIKDNFGDLNQAFPLNTDSRLRGHSLKLQKENFKTRTRQHFLSNRIFEVWNNLPQEIIDSQSVNIYKNNIDRHIFHNS